MFWLMVHWSGVAKDLVTCLTVCTAEDVLHIAACREEVYHQVQQLVKAVPSRLAKLKYWPFLYKI